METKTTEALIKKAKRHDSEAFTKLMQFYLKDMYKTANAILLNDEDSADAIQDTILACWEKIGMLKQPEYFKTWMTRILINKCYDIRKKRIPSIEIEEVSEPWADDTYNLELKEALSQIDDKYRIPITLFYSEGYAIKEIASILEIPISTIQTRLARGREKLAAYYGVNKTTYNKEK